MGGLCTRCSDAIFSHMERPGDTEKERGLRRIGFSVCAALALGSAVSIAGLTTGLGTWTVGILLVCLAVSSGAVAMLLRVAVSVSDITGFVALVALAGVLILDLSTATRVVARWFPAVIVVMDALLVFECKQYMQRIAVAATFTYLAAEQAESAFHYGLYELGAIGEDATVVACDCSDPPCAAPVPSAAFTCLLYVLILGTDMFVTRRFAILLTSQLAAVDTAVRVAERVACLLAAYATDDARKVVEAEGAALPGALRDSYEQLLCNLDSYRVFLPDSLLAAAKEEMEDDGWGIPGEQRTAQERPPPGLHAESPEVAVCFTDIQSSTALWEAHPQGMYEGLNLHNKVMREAYAASRGYEVKTIGDSFMVAFDTVLDGLRFGLAAQQGLLRQDWPDDLLTHPLCARISGPSGKPLWGGLRVRIGVQHGPVRAECNPVTGRCDYFGHTVNTAARLEAALRKGGLVATTQTVVQSLGPAELEQLGSPVLLDAGSRELKGVKDPMNVWALVPQELSLRAEVLDELKSTENSTSAHSGQVDGGIGLLRVTRAGTNSSLPVRRVATGTTLYGSGGSMSAHSSMQCHPRGHAKPANRISLRLAQKPATVATVRIALRHATPVSDRISVFALAVATAADQTQGVVDSLLSACITATWNASKPCVDHAAAARRFVSSPFRSPCHLGVTSGEVLCGNVAAGRRSFATVVGGSVELSAALAEEAERCGDTALATGAVAELCAAAGDAYWAQLWQSGRGAPTVVWELSLRSYAGKWDLDTEEDDTAVQDCTEDTAWVDTFAGLFRQACAVGQGSDEERDAVRGKLAEFAANTPLLKQRASRLETRLAGADGVVRYRPMPILWQPAPLADGLNVCIPGVAVSRRVSTAAIGALFDASRDTLESSSNCAMGLLSLSLEAEPAA